MENEFYRNEYPTDPGSGGGGGGNGSGGGWGFTGGGGGSGGGGGGTHSQCGWGDNKGDDEGDSTVWSEINVPLLKKCANGFLLQDGITPKLLTGSLMCRCPPSIICWINGDDEHKHSDCLLLTADVANIFSWVVNPNITKQQYNSGMCAHGFLSWVRPGTITFAAKWQSGHYAHGKISKARFAVFGVDLGYRVLALKRYITVFTIKITEDHEIYVNDIRGNLNGNGKFLE